MSEIEYCERCRRPVDQANDPTDSWEALMRDDGSVGVMCSSCLTREEKRPPWRQSGVLENLETIHHAETFEVDTELTRGAIYAGVWTRLCCEMRGHAEGHHLEQYMEHHAEGRGDPAQRFAYLDEDIGHLTAAQRQLRAVEQTPLGSMVRLDDVRRFMPRAWVEDLGRWLYTEIEIEKIRESGGQVATVRELGSDEQWRGR